LRGEDQEHHDDAEAKRQRGRVAARQFLVRRPRPGDPEAPRQRRGGDFLHRGERLTGGEDGIH